ncbi:MAG: hypothetical protein VKN83_10095, partial [Cyanobacteriota bacterium]|nr:hypothetical protein [Cyanobacteriota bacterium]
LLASAGGDMDQSSTRRKRTSVGYLGKGCLMGGRGVIFPGSYRCLVPYPILARLLIFETCLLMIMEQLMTMPFSGLSTQT